MQIRLWRAASAVHHADNTLPPRATRPRKSARHIPPSISDDIRDIYLTFPGVHTRAGHLDNPRTILGLALSAMLFCSSAETPAAVGRQSLPDIADKFS